MNTWSSRFNELKNSLVSYVTKQESPFPKQQESQLITALDKELKQELDTLFRKKNASVQEVQESINRMSSRLLRDLKKKHSARIRKIYEKSVAKVARQLGRGFTLQEQDKLIIDTLKKDPIYQEAFAGVSLGVSSKLRDIVIEESLKPGGFQIDSIVSKIKEVSSATNSSLRRIARTETGKIASAARKISYDKTGLDLKYFHIGPSDTRTTDLSKRIVDRTKNGVSWEEYIAIMQEESSKDFPEWIVDPRFPLSHYNSRHIFIARVV